MQNGEVLNSIPGMREITPPKADSTREAYYDTLAMSNRRWSGDSADAFTEVPILLVRAHSQ
jgi:hypothetical protein